jgi:flagellar biosynthesis chaperone FliJ
MKTRYTPLVTLKKSAMDKSERGLQSANADLNSATMALKLSYNLLLDIETPKSGAVSSLLASRTLLSSQRGLIEHNHKWVDFAKNQVKLAKKQLKLDMIEHEKFKYLEVQEVKKMIKEQKIKEVKELDEIALMRYGQKDKS